MSGPIEGALGNVGRMIDVRFRAQEELYANLEARVAALEAAPPDPPDPPPDPDPEWSTEPGGYPFNFKHSPTYAQLEKSEYPEASAQGFADGEEVWTSTNKEFPEGVDSKVRFLLRKGGFRGELGMKHPNYFGTAKMPWKGRHRIRWSCEFPSWERSPHASIHGQIHAAEGGTKPLVSIQRREREWYVRRNYHEQVGPNEYVRHKVDHAIDPQPSSDGLYHFELDAIFQAHGNVNPGEDEGLILVRCGGETLFRVTGPNAIIPSSWDIRDHQNYFRIGIYWPAFRRISHPEAESPYQNQIAVHDFVMLTPEPVL